MNGVCVDPGIVENAERSPAVGPFLANAKVTYKSPLVTLEGEPSPVYEMVTGHSLHL